MIERYAMKPQSLTKRLFPPMVLLLLCGGIFLYTPVRGYLFPQKLHTSDRMEDFYNTQNPYAAADPSVLYDSGYDCLIGGKTAGSYYYSLDNGQFQLYLLDKKLSAGTSDTISGLSIKGLLVKMDDTEYEHLLQQMAKDLEWSSSKLSAIASPYMLSTLPSLNRMHAALLAALLFSAAIAAADIVITAITYQKAKKIHSRSLSE